jgi:membrane-associated phospholipid phosphatase
LETVTNFGDLAVLLPVAVIVAMGLLVKAGPRHVAIWLLAVGGCALTIALLKVTLCCGGLPAIASPSGHTAMSTVVYGGLGFLIVGRRRRWQRAFATAFAALGVVGIAYSRVAVRAHTQEEVFVGLMIGSVFLLVLILLMRRQGVPPQLEKGAGAITLAATCAALLLHGQHVVTPHICVCWSAF